MADSGASACFMTKALASKVKADIDPKKKWVVELANGITGETLGKCCPRMAIGDHQASPVFLVMNALPATVDAILEETWLEEHEVELSWKTHSMSMGRGKSRYKVYCEENIPDALQSETVAAMMVDTPCPANSLPPPPDLHFLGVSKIQSSDKHFVGLSAVTVMMRRESKRSKPRFKVWDGFRKDGVKTEPTVIGYAVHRVCF